MKQTDRQRNNTHTKQKRYNPCNAIQSKAKQAKQRPKRARGVGLEEPR